MKIVLLNILLLVAMLSEAVAGEAGNMYFKSEMGYGFSRGKVRIYSEHYSPKSAKAWPTLDLSPANHSPRGGTSYESHTFQGASWSTGLGYNISAAVRADLTFTHNFEHKILYSYSKDNFFNYNGADPVSNINNDALRHKSWLIMLTLYYDFKNTSDYTPFVHAGMGYANTKNIAILGEHRLFNTTREEEGFVFAEKNLAWNIGTGLAYQISDYVSADLSYKLISLKSETKIFLPQKFETGQTAAINYVRTPTFSHSANLGLRFDF